jgi:hypothetical protein
MDIISYGIANKAGSSTKKTRDTTLATGVQGKFANVKERIDSLERAFEGLTLKANKLIVNDAVNIMKAHAKLNAVAKTSRYKMQNMVFDDLLDMSGISGSENSTHDAILGLLKATNQGNPFSFETSSEEVEASPEKVILTVEEASTEAGANVALGKPVTESTGKSLSRPDLITDGNKTSGITGSSGYAHTSRAGEVQVDLQQVYSLDSIKLYMWYGDGRMYNDTRVRVSADGSNWETVFDVAVDGNYATSAEGKEIKLNGKNVRYIRSYSNGNTSNADTHWIEIEAFVAKEEATKAEGEYHISRDGGETWEAIIPDELFYFDANVSPEGTQLKVKGTIPGKKQLLNYALTWA